jgi:hypothetical protein
MCWMTAAATAQLMLCDPGGRKFASITLTVANSGEGL